MFCVALCLVAACDDAASSVAPDPDAGVASVFARAPEDGLVSDEIDLDEPVPVALPFELPETTVFTGEHHVVIWRDRGVRAARLAPDGSLVDEIAVRLGNNVQDVQAAFTGEEILLVFRRTVDGDDVIELARFSPALEPITDEVVEVTRDSAILSGPRIAFGDGVALVTWARTETIGGVVRHDVLLQRIAVGGALLGDAIPLTSPATQDRFPDVAFADSQFVVAWQRDGSPERVLASRVTPAGDVIDGGGITLATGASAPRPRLAAGGGQWLAAFRDGATLHAVRFSPAMVVLDAAPIDLDTTADSLFSWDVVFDGARFSVGWRHDEDDSAGDAILLRRVGLDGSVSAPLVVDGADAGSPVELSADGTHIAMAWRGRIARIASDDAILDPGGRAFAHRANTERGVAAVGGGGRYLAAWRDDRDGAAGIYAMVLDSAGVPMGDARRVAGPGGVTSFPRVAFDGAQFWVLWMATLEPGVRALHVARVTPDGDVVDAPPLEILPPTTDSISGFDVAGGPAGALVVWAQDGASLDVLGRVITPAGALSGTFPVSAASGSQRNPRAVYADDAFFVVWQDERDVAGLFGARVDASGAVLDPLGRRLTNDRPFFGFALATNGEQHLVAWDDAAAGSRDLEVTEVSLEGEASDPDGRLLVADAHGAVLIADGPRFIAAWRDRGDDFALAAMRVHADGSPASAGGFRVDARVETFVSFALASAVPGQAMTLFELPERVTGIDGRQVRARRITLLADGLECTDGAGCASGFCVDGVCCDSACGDGDPTDCQACSPEGTCGPIAAGTTCRGADGACDVAEVCDGEQLACPVDAPADNGVACDDGDGCTVDDACSDGACVGAAFVCPEPAPCHGAGVCTGDTGACDYEPVPNGTACPGGTCESGVCIGLPDAGIPDAGIPDAGVADAGVADAGLADAAVPDSGVGDAGLPPGPDASAPNIDASAPDAGRAEPPVSTSSDGCGCAATGNDRGGAGAIALVGLALVLGRRRRRAFP